MALKIKFGFVIKSFTIVTKILALKINLGIVIKLYTFDTEKSIVIEKVMNSPQSQLITV